MELRGGQSRPRIGTGNLRLISGEKKQLLWGKKKEKGENGTIDKAALKHLPPEETRPDPKKPKGREY